MARLIATSRMRGTNEANVQEIPAELREHRLKLIITGTDNIAGMGKLRNFAPLYRLTLVSTRVISLESLVIMGEAGFRESPRWLSWPPVENLGIWPID